jgi:hypothetical protein
MASGASKIIRGAFKGTAADLDVRGIPFKPRSVKLWNEDGLCSGVWIEGMADGTGLKTITAGTISALVAGITPLSDGFRLGNDSDLNVAGEKVYYECSD